MSGRDRRDIVPLLREHYPELEGLSSDEVAGYLDALTGLKTDPIARNGTVFDAWRKALAAAGLDGVWVYSKERLVDIEVKTQVLKENMERFRLGVQERAAPAEDKAEKSTRRAELEAIAKAQGYKPGWVDHVLEAEAKRGGE